MWPQSPGPWAAAGPAGEVQCAASPSMPPPVWILPWLFAFSSVEEPSIEEEFQIFRLEPYLMIYKGGLHSD